MKGPSRPNMSERKACPSLWQCVFRQWTLCDDSAILGYFCDPADRQIGGPAARRSGRPAAMAAIRHCALRDGSMANDDNRCVVCHSFIVGGISPIVPTHPWRDASRLNQWRSQPKRCGWVRKVGVRQPLRGRGLGRGVLPHSQI